MTVPFEIKHDSEVPAASRYTRYPFGKMAPGDYFETSGAKDTALARQAAFLWGKKNGARFAQRKQEDGTYRIWRIS